MCFFLQITSEESTTKIKWDTEGHSDGKFPLGLIKLYECRILDFEEVWQTQSSNRIRRQVSESQQLQAQLNSDDSKKVSSLS